jgi:hypothetical protein
MKYNTAKCSPSGLFRIFGVAPEGVNSEGIAHKPCVWIGTVMTPEGVVEIDPKLKLTSILHLRSAGGRHTAELPASDLNFS